MSNSTVTVPEQLIELFPNVDEDFLRGLCETYFAEGNMDIDELIDIVLSFEYPPQRNSTEENDCSDDNTVKISDEIPAQTFSICPMQACLDEKQNETNGENSVVPILEDKISLSDIIIVGYNNEVSLESTCNVEESVGRENTLLNVIKSDCGITSTEKASLMEQETGPSQLSPESSNSLENNCKRSLLAREENEQERQTESADSTSGVQINYVIHLDESEKNTKENKSLFTFTKDLEEKDVGHETIEISDNEEEEKNLVPETITKCSDPVTDGSCFIEPSCSKYINQPQFCSSSVTSPLSEHPHNKRHKKSLRSSTSSSENSSPVRRVPLLRSCKIKKNKKMSRLKPLYHSRISLENSTKENNQTILDSSFTSEDSAPGIVKRVPLLPSCKRKTNRKMPKLKPVGCSRVSLEKTMKEDNQNRLDPSFALDTPGKKFLLLYKILPNADPEYLSAQSHRISQKEELLMFISKSLDVPDYPRVHNNKAEKSNKMAKFECTVEEFLQEIPDPIAEFSSNYYIRTGYDGNSEIYLQSRYQSLRLDVLKERLNKYNYNLVKVCELLDSEGHEASPYCLDNVELPHSPTIFFHQEVWFIEHKAQVQNYKDSQAAKVEEELKVPVAPPIVNEVFECKICREDVTEYNELGSCDGPGADLFCNTCIRRHVEIKLSEGATTFPCLANCGGFIPLQTIQEVLPANTYEILTTKIQEAEVQAANIPGIETCPFCPYACGPDQASLFTCLNPTCLKVSCRICRKLDHSPDICDFLKNEDEETARHYIENKMTEALVRECYSCGKPYVKTSGCNKIQCACGAKMCYLCRQPVTDYSHFNGQGGIDYTKCELFSDEKTVHDRPVADSAKQALNELLANNPGMNLDQTKIVPK